MVWHASMKHEKAWKASGKGRLEDNNSHLVLQNHALLRLLLHSSALCHETSSAWWVRESKETWWLIQMWHNNSKEHWYLAPDFHLCNYKSRICEQIIDYIMMVFTTARFKLKRSENKSIKYCTSTQLLCKVVIYSSIPSWSCNVAVTQHNLQWIIIF